MSKSRLPKGWDESRVKRVAEHYEAQTDEEATKKDESVYKTTTHTSLNAFAAELRR